MKTLNSSRTTPQSLQPHGQNSAKFASHYRQLGFTLVELMISMVIGLLILAAAMSLFLGSARSINFQESADDVQDAAVFSLSYIQKEIAMANLGAHEPITQESAWTGIVFTPSENHPSEKLPGSNDFRQVGNLRGVNLSIEDVAKWGSKSKAVLDFGELNNNVNLNSDQLTIQYQAPFDLIDCEGQARLQGQMVVERFFTRQDRVLADAEPFNIVLACDAGWYDIGPNVSPDEVAAGSIVINDFGGDGEVIINRVDYFGVRLGIQNGSNITYIPIADYMEKSNNAYVQQGEVVAIQIGAIVRGVTPIGTDTQEQFTVFDQANPLTIANTDKKYIRRVYKNTIRLRNAKL